MKPIAIRALALIITLPSASVAQERSGIRLAEIEGRTWLITPEGKPCFAHGITHVSNRSLRTDYNAVSKACKDLGFNKEGIKQGLFGEGLTPRPGLGETVIELNRHIDRVTPGRNPSSPFTLGL